jgi:hypothetical protein
MDSAFGPAALVYLEVGGYDLRASHGEGSGAVRVPHHRSDRESFVEQDADDRASEETVRAMD